jgi:tRNA pseudouridine55 synthase
VKRNPVTVETGPDGVLLVDKPAGMTSHAVVDRARRVLGTKRIGHGGTLDPFATGLLTILVGRATRLLPFVQQDPKVYRATIRFGAATSTDDVTGDVVREAKLPAAERVTNAIESMTGHMLQRPPAYSAKQVGGVRAYAAARRGKPLSLEPVAVTVYTWTVVASKGAELEVDVSCSGGTYVRALARDLGEAADSAAHLVALRRMRSGAFDLAGALTLDALDRGEARLMPPAMAVSHLPAQVLDDLEAKRIVHGQTVTARVDGERAALSHAGELLAVAVREADAWRPKVVMRDA